MFQGHPDSVLGICLIFMCLFFPDEDLVRAVVLCLQKCDTMFWENLKVPEGHHPRGTILLEAHRGKLPLRGVLRGLCRGLSEGFAGLCEVELLRWCTASSEGRPYASDPEELLERRILQGLKSWAWLPSSKGSAELFSPEPFLQNPGEEGGARTCL